MSDQNLIYFCEINDILSPSFYTCQCWWI